MLNLGGSWWLPMRNKYIPAWIQVWKCFHRASLLHLLKNFQSRTQHIIHYEWEECSGLLDATKYESEHVWNLHEVVGHDELVPGMVGFGIKSLTLRKYGSFDEGRFPGPHMTWSATCE
jgi:hypothetical protein